MTISTLRLIPILLSLSFGAIAQQPVKPLRAQDTIKPVVKPDSARADTTKGGDTVKVSGTVTLGGGAADLSGTSVEVKGSGKGVISTDSTGHFTMAVPGGATLVISHVGYKTLEADVTGKQNIEVTLQKDANTLEQVTVSYGKQAKRDITGAVSKVDATAAADIPATEFGQKLQGKVAGVQIQQTSGLPGNNIVFRIRGAADRKSVV